MLLFIQRNNDSRKKIIRNEKQLRNFNNKPTKVRTDGMNVFKCNTNEIQLRIHKTINNPMWKMSGLELRSEQYDEISAIFL